MFRGSFTSRRWAYNRLIYLFGIGYLIAIILTAIISFTAFWRIPVTLDTARAILSTIMGVSGSILGFLVIYLTLALDSIRRYFGRYSISVFKNDPLIWILCLFFSYIIVLSLVAFSVVDLPGAALSFLFNLSCVSFILGIVLIVPIGVVVLSRTDSAVRIQYFIDLIHLKDFKPRPAFDGVLSISYWIYNEDPNNSVDRFTAILIHNISEGNINVVSGMLTAFRRHIQQLTRQHQNENMDEAYMRFNDILSIAFGQVKGSGDEVTIKLIFEVLQVQADVIATLRMGHKVVRSVLLAAREMLQFLIEQENEPLSKEGFWRTTAMFRSQVLHNFPSKAEKEKYEVIRDSFGYGFSKLIDRSFRGSNKYITENAIKMQSYVLAVLTRELTSFQEEKNEIGRRISYEISLHVKKWAGREKSAELGFQYLMLSPAEMREALKDSGPLPLSIVIDYCSVANYLVNNRYCTDYDLRQVGQVGNDIVDHAESLHQPVDMMRQILAYNRNARMKLSDERTQCEQDKRAEELDGMLTILKNDLAGWMIKYQASGANILELGDMIRVFQIPA